MLFTNHTHLSKVIFSIPVLLHFREARHRETTIMACFTSIATRYNDLYGFMFEPFAELILQYVQFGADDHLADVGGGTGAVSHLVWKTAGE